MLSTDHNIIRSNRDNGFMPSPGPEQRFRSLVSAFPLPIMPNGRNLFDDFACRRRGDS